MLTGNSDVRNGIAHPKRDGESYDELCVFLGVSDELQCALKINWERPHDVSRVIDWLETIPSKVFL